MIVTLHQRQRVILTESGARETNTIPIINTLNSAILARRFILRPKNMRYGTNNVRTSVTMFVTPSATLNASRGMHRAVGDMVHTASSGTHCASAMVRNVTSCTTLKTNSALQATLRGPLAIKRSRNNSAEILISASSGL